MRIHKTLTADHWFSLSIFEQLANIGCDIERTIAWKKQNQPDFSKKAFERVLELLDLTIADPQNKGGRLKELVRTREALVDYFVYDNTYNSTEEQWKKYFYDFNYAAALQHGR